MLVGECMSTDIHAVRPDTSLVEAAQQMRISGVGGIPVLGHGGEQCAGILTERDIIIRVLAEGLAPLGEDADDDVALGEDPRALLAPVTEDRDASDSADPHLLSRFDQRGVGTNRVYVGTHALTDEHPAPPFSDSSPTRSGLGLTRSPKIETSGREERRPARRARRGEVPMPSIHPPAPSPRRRYAGRRIVAAIVQR